jgi:hypothetical protein
MAGIVAPMLRNESSLTFYGTSLLNFCQSADVNYLPKNKKINTAYSAHK